MSFLFFLIFLINIISRSGVARCMIGAIQLRPAMGLNGTYPISCLSSGNVMEALHIVVSYHKSKYFSKKLVLFCNFILQGGVEISSILFQFQGRAKEREEIRVLTNFVSVTGNSLCALISIDHALKARLLAKIRNVYGKTS